MRNLFALVAALIVSFSFTTTVEVTKAQWEAVMKTTPWSGQEYALDDPNSPADYVSWDNA